MNPSGSIGILRLAALVLGLVGAGVKAQVTKVNQSATAGTFTVVGNSGASAQQIFLGTAGRLYVIDKAEGNPLQVNGHCELMPLVLSWSSIKSDRKALAPSSPSGLGNRI